MLSGVPRAMALTRIVLLALVPAFVGSAQIPVTPPAGHPRLLLRPGDLPEMKRRIDDTFFARAWKQVLRNSSNAFDGTLSTTPANYNPLIHDVTEARALRFLLEGDRTEGRKAVDTMVRVLPNVTYPDQQDITRAKGATIFTAALVYDWCFPLLTAEERELFITNMMRIARLTEIGYPPVRGGAITGHSGEAQLMRDQLGGGIAVYDEDPEMYQLAAKRFFAEFVPARDFWYRGEHHHQGSSYGPYRYQWEIMASWIFRRMAGVDVFRPEQGRVPYAWVYGQRPDGAILPDGDRPSILRRNTQAPNANAGLFFAASYYHDEVLNGVAKKQLQARDSFTGTIWYFLFADPKLGTKPLESLPLSHYFPDPTGRMIARTGWADGGAAPVVVAEMKVSPWMFNNHQHLDAGDFQLWYKGALATGSGTYLYGTNHDLNYYKRTIAHNTVTVFDPEEVFTWGKGKTLLNDGGQRWPANGSEPATLEVLKEKGHEVGRVLSHAIGPDPMHPEFSHLSGDLTGTYSPKKMERFLRSFVFLNLYDSAHPAVLLVYDRVRSSRPEFEKKWLLHTPDKPDIGDAAFTTHGVWGGRMDASVLLPEAKDARITSVGGPGSEFTVNGVNQPPEATKGVGPEYENFGWRIELSPRQPQKQDQFLVAMQVRDDNAGSAPLEATRFDAQAFTGVRIADRVVLFPRSDEFVAAAATLTIPASGPHRILITGLAAGRWTVTQAGKSTQLTVGAEEHTLYFRSTGGQLRIAPR